MATDATSDVLSVEEFDLRRYLGLWYEIGRLPLKYQDEDSRDVTAEYSLNEDGSVRVDNRCLDGEGAPTQAVARAVPVEGATGQLRVNFLPKFLRWLPFTEGDYWVLELDPGYATALVGSPDREHLWLLARTPAVSEDEREAYLASARAEGFDLTDWIHTPQSGSRVTDDQVED